MGKKFVITGTLTSPRNVVKAAIKKKGGTVVSAVSNQVDYVIAGPDVIGTRKLNKASQLGIPVISESTAWRMLGGRSRSARPTNRGRVLPMRVYGMSPIIAMSRRKHRKTLRKSSSPTRRRKRSNVKSLLLTPRTHKLRSIFSPRVII